jgi:hypothetical protein
VRFPPFPLPMAERPPPCAGQQIVPSSFVVISS